MTDQTIPDVTDDDRVLAREWAEFIESDVTGLSSRRKRAAARVILDAVPTPPLPTLANMTPKERVACRLMQADVEERESRAVIINPHWEDGSARVLWPGGIIEQIGWERVTPRPDLPRMEWPGDGQDGEEVTKVDYVSVAGGRTAYGPWTVARLRKKPDAVPESTLAVGSVWDDADALEAACDGSWRDQITVIDCAGNVSVWDERGADWRGSAPLRFAPFTILHDGKKADQ